MAALVAAATAAWWHRRPFTILIDGASMRPTLEPGDWALATRVHRVRPGDVVVLEHPDRPGFELVKRVTATAAEGRAEARELEPGQVWVQGDGPGGSTDSRSFGPVSSDLLRGRVVLVWWPPARWRLV
jgi:nickel-type superoxide dismutase maturation protease